MKLVPMIPQIYRFMGDQGEQIHSHRETEALADDKFHWGWCNLQELWDILVANGIQGPIQGPWHLIRLEHLYVEEQGEKRKRLWVAVRFTHNTRFVKATQENTKTIEAMDPILVFVPLGWAQTIVNQFARHRDLIIRNRL